jgi:D-alanyl-D-alanine carboxypeptidase/D-alanyl-D-alanine-endopeptidase (penicillin-binding protein 4)
VRLGALLCAISAAVCLFFGLSSSPTTTVASATVAPVAESGARRTPHVFATELQHAAMRRAVQRAVNGVDACVTARDSAGPIANINASQPMIPASTLKVLTALAVIDRLGATRRINTGLVVGGAPGTYVLVGAGDPLLESPSFAAGRQTDPRFRNTAYTSLAALADRIAAAGVHKINVLGVDDHVADSVRYLPNWKISYGQEGNVGSLGALSVDSGFVSPTEQRPAADPAITAGQRLAELLVARHVTVGPVRRIRATDSARLVATVASPPMSAMVGEMVTASDDYTAEELTRLIGHGSTARGTQAIRDTLAALGVPMSGVAINDGSGLARDDRVTCAALLAAIALTQQPRFSTVNRALPIGGETGTLVIRFRDDALGGRLRAKTGTLDNVTGLTGVVDRDNGLQFAFLATGNFSTQGGDDLADAVARVLATARATPVDAAAIVPSP